MKLTSPPQFGEVVLKGAGFLYSPKADFQGQDSFSIAVFGAVDGKHGSSTIQVEVFVRPNGTRDTAPLSLAPGGTPNRTSRSTTHSMNADTTPPPASIIAPSDDATGPGWRTLKIGAGGYIRGIDIECDQGVGQCNNSGTTTKVIRTDTYGAYVWITSGNCSPNVSAPCWLQLVTNRTLPSGDPMNTPYACWNTTFTTCGVYEIRIAPSNTNIAYMMLNGYVYKTTNLRSGSPTWRATRFIQDTTSNPNDIYAQFGPKIAIDPANADIVIVCTEGRGCFKTANGGMSFGIIAGITNAASVGMLVAFDPSSSVTDGATQGIYISSYETGVYHSTDGGLSWTLTANTPTTHTFMNCTLAGVLYFVANSGASDQTLHIFSGGSWSSVSVGGNGNAIAGVAVDPANFNNIVAVNSAGQLTYSTNAASSFGGYVSQVNTSRIATDIPWLGWTNETYMTAGQIIFDPAQSDALFFAEGIGVWTANPSTSISPEGKNTYTSHSKGIEQLVGQDIISPWGCVPGCNPVTLEGDRPTFYVGDPDIYPSTHGAANPQARAIVWGHGIDWATGSPRTLVANAAQQGDGSGTSSNGGQTWTPFGGTPANYPSKYIGGGIAAGSSDVFIWALSNDGQLSETSDGGRTWATPSIDGVSAAPPFGWNHAFFSDRQIVTSDRVNSNTFYAYNGACNGSSSIAGIYKGVYSSGWTWTRAKSGHFDNYDCGNSILKSVPGNAGEMYFTSGITNPGPYPHNIYFYDCQDTNAIITCKPVSKVKEVWAFGFGAAKPGGNGYPTIYIAGWVSQDGGQTYKFGIWRSTDHALTWTNLGIPLNSLDIITAVEGDANIYGRVYVAFGGSGFAYGQFN